MLQRPTPPCIPGPPPPARARRTPSRRGPRAATGAGVLVAALLGGVSLTACTDDGGLRRATPTTSPRLPTADELAQARAVARTRDLLDLAVRVSRTPDDGDHASRATERAVRTAVAAHREQLLALGATTGTPTGSAASPEGTPGPTASVPATTSVPATSGTTGATADAPAGPAASPRRLATAEWTAARETLADVGGAGDGLATLLARQAAAMAATADLLDGATGRERRGPLTPAARGQGDDTAGEPAGSTATAPSRTAAPDPSTASSPGTTGTTPSTTGATPATSPSPEVLDALAQEVAGEHAAVYATAVVAGRSTGRARDRALTAYTLHVRLRDGLERALLAAGGEPPPAAAGYDVGPVPGGAGPAALAGAVEGGLASLAAQTVGRTEGPERLEAALRLVGAARRAAAWTGRSPALPGGGIAATPVTPSPRAGTSGTAPAPAEDASTPEVSSSPESSSPTATG